MGPISMAINMAAAVGGMLLARAVTHQDDVLRYPPMGPFLMGASALGIFASQRVSARTRFRVGTEQCVGDRAEGSVVRQASSSSGACRG